MNPTQQVLKKKHKVITLIANLSGAPSSGEASKLKPFKSGSYLDKGAWKHNTGDAPKAFNKGWDKGWGKWGK